VFAHAQAAAQRELGAEQAERVRDLEAGARALDGRCADLRQAGAGAEARARGAAAEVLKANRIIEQLTARRGLAACAARHAPRRGGRGWVTQLPCLRWRWHGSLLQLQTVVICPCHVTTISTIPYHNSKRLEIVGSQPMAAGFDNVPRSYVVKMWYSQFTISTTCPQFLRLNAPLAVIRGRMLLVAPPGHHSVHIRDVQGRGSAHSHDPVA